MYDTKSLQLTYILIITTCENMHVVEGEYVKLDTEYKKRFLDAYFGGGEYYYHDLEHYTVDELDTYIDLKYRELNKMNSRDDVDDSAKQELAQQMEPDLSGFLTMSASIRFQSGQFFTSDISGITYICIQAKENSLEHFTAEDAVIG